MTGFQGFVLVTGASSGLGRATAVRLSRHWSLILSGRDISRLEETRRACSHPEYHLLWPFDLHRLDDLEGSLKEAMGTRPISGFVHCAGMVKVLPVQNSTPEVFQETLAVNTFSAAEVVRLLSRRRNNGEHLQSVVFVSSIWSRFGSRGHAAYCASKAALDGLMRALAVELAPRIRVNSIQPGAIATPMAAAGMEDTDILAGFNRDYPLGLGQPDDVAHAIAYLLSEEARWMTGHALVLDGGRTANMSLK